MALLEKVDKNIAARSWQGEIPIQGRYTYGLAGEKFFREIMENGRFMGTHCPECDYTYVPPTIYCERCFTKLDEWVEVGPEGTVQSFTVLLVAPDGSPLDEPDILALIQLDGADSVLVHRLGKVSLDELAIGMRVKAVLKPKKQREGSILDIVHFVPIND
ncbi:MAG: Zn-ribbon domain-containing OB-fold protein [Anaerolineae bacterium]